LGNVSVAVAANADADAQSASPPPQATPASIVVSQNPGVGQKIMAGSVVTFEVR
jgi:hypothetical protein